jgi:hypothetical protein
MYAKDPPLHEKRRVLREVKTENGRIFLGAFEGATVTVSYGMDAWYEIQTPVSPPSDTSLVSLLLPTLLSVRAPHSWPKNPEQIEDIYGFETSAELISRVTDRIVPQIEEWQNRTLSEIYPILFIDAIIFNVRKEKMVQKRAVYIVLGINSEGMKDVLSIEIGDVESSKYWFSVLNSLKNGACKIFSGKIIFWSLQ